MRYVIILFLFLGVVIAQEMAPYCCAPPFISVTAKPNILLVKDVSGSQLRRAEWHINMGYYDPDRTHYGYFKEGVNYFYKNGVFYPQGFQPGGSTGPFPGSIMNWACMSRIDVSRKVINGGKGVPASGFPKHTLECEGSGDGWPAYLCTRTGGTVVKYRFSKPKRTEIKIDTTTRPHIWNFPYPDTIILSQRIPPGTYTLKIDIPKSNWANWMSKGVLREIADKDLDDNFDEDGPRIGLFFYTSHQQHFKVEKEFWQSEGPRVEDFMTALNNVGIGGSDPVGKAVLDAVCYIAWVEPRYGAFQKTGDAKSDPYRTRDGRHIVWCRKSFVILIGDGEANSDNPYTSSYSPLPVGPFPTRDLNNYDGNPEYDPSVSGSDYLNRWLDYPLKMDLTGNKHHPADDYAYYGHITDLRPDIPAKQNIEFYTIFSFGRGAALFQEIAKDGGFDDINKDNIPQVNEYDKDGNGIPDNYFEAEDGYKLEEAIRKVITEILAKVSSSSAAGVVSAGTKGAGFATMAQFYPLRNFPTGEQLDWTGSIYSLWIDKFGLLREDYNQDRYLHLKNDYVVNIAFDNQIGDVVVKRYQDVKGDGDSLVYVESVSLDQLRPVWDGGRWLWNASPNSRTIKAFVDADKDGIVDPGEYIDFIPTNAGTFRPHLGVPNDQSADTVIRYIRGWDFPNLRTRTAGGKVWKLGDIINSSATVVARPMERYDYLYGDITYQHFWNACSLRRPMVYVGANDGMLHAFNAGYYQDISDPDPFKVGYQNPLGSYSLGQELWAHIPYNLLAHLKWLRNPQYCHVYYVDLTPYPTDVRIFTPSAVHPQGWGTILTYGMRLGGGEIRTPTDTLRSAYGVIDVSDPLNPKPLWEFKHPNLRYTLAYPTVIRMRDRHSNAPDSVKWFMLLGSGSVNCAGESNQQARIYVLNLATGVAERIFTVPDANSFVANIFGIDWDMDYSVDLIYFSNCFRDNTAPGGWGGRIYRIKTRKSTNPADWHLSPVTVNLQRPMIAEGSVAVDELNRLWVYFGSGRLFNENDEVDTTRQLFVGIKEDTVSTFSLSTMYNVTNVWIDTMGNAHIGATIKPFEEFMDDVYVTNGWYRYFAKGGERSLTPTLVYGGAVLFTTFTPTADVCGYGGVGNLYALYYRTGTAHPAAYLGDTLGVYRIFKSLGPGMPSEPALYVTADQTKVFIQTYGGIVQQETGLPAGLKPGVILWKGR